MMDSTKASHTQAIDAELCVKCGACADICPVLLYAKTENGIEIKTESSQLCVACGHCMSVCPTQAVTVSGLDLHAFASLGGAPATPEGLGDLMLKRRSVRRFTDESVPAEMLQQLVDAAAMAPMGFPPSEVEVSVVPDRALVEKVVAPAVEAMRGLGKAMSSPVSRFFMLRMMGPKERVVIGEHLVPMIEPLLTAWDDDRLDKITWGAPAMLVFHIERQCASTEVDATLCATYSMLMAEALGLGSVILGIARHAIQQTAELRELYRIPPQNDILSVLCVGFPDVKFRRSIPRHLRGVHWAKRDEG